MDARDKNSPFDKKTKQHPSQRDDACTAAAAPAELGEASKVRHDEQTAHPMADLISSH